MNITLNGAAHTTDNPQLLHLVAQTLGAELNQDGTRADGKALGVAVAVNHAVIARSQWVHHQLTEGDSVEIVTAVQGG